MSSSYPDLDLPDRGQLLTEMVHSLAGPEVASIVAAEVDGVRAPSGALAVENLHDYRKPKDGPLHALSLILTMDAMAAGAWAQMGFGLLQRRSSGRKVEEMARREGVDAAVVWALVNGNREKLHVDVIRAMLNDFHNSDRAEMVWNVLGRSLRKWR